MRSLARFGALVVAVAGLIVASGNAQTSRPIVALLDLDFGSINDWWGGKWLVRDVSIWAE